MTDVLGLSNINLTGSMDFIWIGVVMIVGMIVFGVAIWMIYVWMSYNIEVVIKRQLGDPIIDEKGKKIIPVETQNTVGRLYNKKIAKNVGKEYFKIKGTSFDYQNYFPDSAFYNRKRGIFDFKNKGIEFLLTQDKGLIPLTVSNPGLMTATVQINEVISAISDSLKERDELYQDDFWSKYGQIITITFLIAFFFIGMMMLIKYQEVFWENSMNQMQTVLQTLKDTARPTLPGG